MLALILTYFMSFFLFLKLLLFSVFYSIGGIGGMYFFSGNSEGVFPASVSFSILLYHSKHDNETYIVTYEY